MIAAMIGLLGNAYLWVKAGHLIFVIFWMAGLFMMPRFFVYHQECAPGSAEERLWVDREARLLRIILKPSMIITWVFGIALALDIGALAQGWFHLKLLAVVGLSAYHGWMVGYARKLAAGSGACRARRSASSMKCRGWPLSSLSSWRSLNPFNPAKASRNIGLTSVLAKPNRTRPLGRSCLDCSAFRECSCCRGSPSLR